MMHFKTLGWLAALALAAAIAALLLSSDRAAVSERALNEPLVPGLMDSVNDVAALAVFDAESGNSVRLEKRDGGWVVAERAGFPAQLPELRKALLALADARLIEAKTRNPDFYPRLGVEDPEAEGAASKRVTVEWADREPLVLIAGSTGFRADTTTYVRRAGEAESWVATGNLSLDADPMRWLEKAVIDLPTPTVRRVVIEHPDGDRVELEKATRELPNFDLVNLPDGRELLAPASPNSIAGALASLRLDDVVPLSEFDAGDVEPVLSTFESFDGQRITVRSWILDDERWVSLEVGFDPDLVVPLPSGADEDPGEDAEVAPEAPLDGDAARAGAEADAARVSGWVFRIPSYKFSNLTKRLDDLLKPAEAMGDVADSPGE